MLLGRSFGERVALPVFRSKIPQSLTLQREDLEDESQGYNSTNLISLFRAAPSPSVPAQAVPSHPASRQQTRKGTCTQPLPSQAKATAAHRCASQMSWAPAPCHSQCPLPPRSGLCTASPLLPFSPPAAESNQAPPADIPVRSAQKAKAAATRYATQHPHFPRPDLPALALCRHSAIPLHGTTATTLPPVLTTKSNSITSHSTMVPSIWGKPAAAKSFAIFTPGTPLC